MSISNNAPDRRAGINEAPAANNEPEPLPGKKARVEELMLRLTREECLDGYGSCIGEPDALTKAQIASSLISGLR